MRRLSVVEDNSDLPLTEAEAKLHCKIDVSDDDALIESLIAAVAELCETELAAPLLEKDYRLLLDSFPDEITLLARTSAVASVKYYDSNNVLQTLSTDDYYAALTGVMASLTPVDAWPETYVRPDAVEVLFTAGWPDADSIPNAVKQWMLLRIKHYYDNRESVAVGVSATEMPASHIDTLLDRYRVQPL
jgi:uncharacterized phiE125 gp8 family phage protein